MPFYGNTFSAIRICTNGWVSFTSASTAYDNQPLPSAGATPENLVAGLWDDLDLRTSGQAYYHNDGSRFIISWVNAPHFASTGTGPYVRDPSLPERRNPLSVPEHRADEQLGDDRHSERRPQHRLADGVQRHIRPQQPGRAVRGDPTVADGRPRPRARSRRQQRQRDRELRRHRARAASQRHHPSPRMLRRRRPASTPVRHRRTEHRATARRFRFGVRRLPQNRTIVVANAAPTTHRSATSSATIRR